MRSNYVDLALPIFLCACGSPQFSGVSNSEHLPQRGYESTSSAERAEDPSNVGRSAPKATDGAQVTKDDSGFNKVALGDCEKIWQEQPKSLSELKPERIQISLENSNDKTIFTDSDSKASGLLKYLNIEVWNLNEAKLDFTQAESWYCVSLRGQNANNFVVHAKNPKRVAFWRFETHNNKTPLVIQAEN